MLSAFTAHPIVELRQRDKFKIESILAYGNTPPSTDLELANGSQAIGYWSD